MSSYRRCLLIDPMHESIFAMLNEIGWQGIDASQKSLEEIKAIVNDYEGLFVRTRTQIDEKLLGVQPKIKFVARAGAGLDNIDVEFLERHSIQVVHASEGNRDAVGEFTIGSLLSLMRNIPRANAEVRKAVWLREENRGMELMGKTVGIIGYGNMGMAFARRLSGFDCKVLAYDKYRINYSDAYAKESSMPELFEQADILSLHVPLTKETKYMVGDSFLMSFAKSIIFINTARGELVKLNTLVAAIKSGKITGAVLDVLENEKVATLSTDQKFAFEFLSNQPNIVFSPHIAGWTFESHVKINQILLQKLVKLGF